jgi:hypothetical protein
MTLVALKVSGPAICAPKEYLTAVKNKYKTIKYLSVSNGRLRDPDVHFVQYKGQKDGFGESTMKHGDAIASFDTGGNDDDDGEGGEHSIEQTQCHPSGLDAKIIHALRALDMQLGADDFCRRICLVRLNEVNHEFDSQPGDGRAFGIEGNIILGHSVTIKVNCEYDTQLDVVAAVGVDGNASLQGDISYPCLWPAIKFVSYQELVQHVAATAIPPDQVNIVKAFLTVEYCRQLRMKVPVGHDVAYLIGRQKSKTPHVVILCSNEEGETTTKKSELFPYYDPNDCAELGRGNGLHCGSVERQAAFDLTQSRIAAQVEMLKKRL